MSDCDENYPQDFTEASPGQKCGWLTKKTRSILKKRYAKVWCELDQESKLGPFKTERLGAFPLDNARIHSGISKKGRLFITITDKTRKKFTFLAVSPAEQKYWLDAIEQTVNGELTTTKVLQKWADDTFTLDKLEISAAAMLALDDKQISDDTIDTPTERSEVEDDLPSDEEERDLQRAMYSKFLLDPEGNLTLFGDVVHGQTTLIYFLRHFGCILMRTCVQEMIDKKEVLEKCGIRLVAIGNGTPEMAKAFLKEYPFPGPLFVDPDKQIYNAMHCKHGVKYALSEDVLRYTRQACERGAHRQNGIQGDPLQLGGVFVISPSKGMIYRRLENYIGSTTDMPNLIPFVVEYAHNHPETTWLSRSPNESDLTNRNNRDFELLYYKDNFIHQLHTIYVLPRSEAVGSTVIVAVMDLKQGDKKCIAFHNKGKTKLYQPCYLNQQEMFEHMTRRIFGQHLEGFIKITRSPAAADRLCTLEETINSYFASVCTSDGLTDTAADVGAQGETGARLETTLDETAQFLLRNN